MTYADQFNQEAGAELRDHICSIDRGCGVGDGCRYGKLVWDPELRRFVNLPK